MLYQHSIVFIIILHCIGHGRWPLSGMTGGLPWASTGATSIETASRAWSTWRASRRQPKDGRTLQRTSETPSRPSGQRKGRSWSSRRISSWRSCSRVPPGESYAKRRRTRTANRSSTHTRFTGTAGRVHCVRIFTHFPCYEPACWSLNFMHFQTSVIRLVDRLTWFYRFGITLQINLSQKYATYQ